MEKHWHKVLFDFEQNLLVNSITQLLSDFSACQFMKHHKKNVPCPLKDICLSESHLN